MARGYGSLRVQRYKHCHCGAAHHNGLLGYVTIGYIEPRTHYLRNWSPRESEPVILGWRGCEDSCHLECFLPSILSNFSTKSCKHCFEGHLKKEKSLTVLEPFRRSGSRDTPNMEGAVLVHAAWGSPLGEPTFNHSCKRQPNVLS